MTTPEHPTAATMYCLGCSHRLDGLTEFRCPECAREFDPTKSETTSDSPPRDALGWLGASLLGVSSIAAVFALGGLGTDGPVCFGLVLQLCVLVAGVSALAFDRSKRALPVYCAIALAICTLMVALVSAVALSSMNLFGFF